MKDQPAKAYLDAQRDDCNRPTVLAFPVLYPREVLTALDLCAWERWSEPSRVQGGADPGRLQGYLCPTVRGAQAVLAAADHGAQAAIIPHTCDSMQGLACVARANRSWSIPVLTFRHPRGSDRPAARCFLRAEVEAFVVELERIFQRRLDSQRLRDAICLHRDVESSLTVLLRARPWLDIEDARLYATLHKLTWLHPEHAREELQDLEQRTARCETRRSGVGLVFSGMVPEPDGLFDTLHQAGAYVAADDYAVFGRRLPGYDGPIAPDPLDSVVERLLLMPPCPTRAFDASQRTAHLRALAKDSGARGVVLHTVKFCEPELFDVGTVQRGLAAHGIKVLHIETEFEAHVTGQIATRLEAFVEMLAEGAEP
ncbi:MAG: 2-hydroxyacyl-CoA dehydratase family protein [Polyangiaceae bacterium]|nr:2-hydroxyacyl-CoA dehydratase family protein [Polyangiaceae bacterium]